MVVKNLIVKLEGFSSESEMACYYAGANPVEDASTINRLFEIRGSEKDGINGVYIEIE